MGEGDVRIGTDQHYEGVSSNVISVTRGCVQFLEKIVTEHLGGLQSKTLS